MDPQPPAIWFLIATALAIMLMALAISVSAEPMAEVVEEAFITEFANEIMLSVLALVAWFVKSPLHLFAWLRGKVRDEEQPCEYSRKEHLEDARRLHGRLDGLHDKLDDLKAMLDN